MNIEVKNYIAKTAADIEKVAAGIIDGDIQAATSRGTYLKMVVATVQAELDSPPRQNTRKVAKLDAPSITAHMTAFQAVAERFYKAVVRVAQNTVPAPDANLVRSRTAFARSAASTVRGYIRGGNDIRALAAARTTKASLATPHKRRKASVAAMARRAQRMATELTALVKTLDAADHGEAVKAMAPIVEGLSNLVSVEMPARVVRVTRHRAAAAESRVQ